MNKSESKYFHTALRMNEALISLLEKKDLEFITAKEICETAGVNRSTFYLHYTDIYNMLDSIEKELFEELETTFQAHAAGTLEEEAFTARTRRPVRNERCGSERTGAG